MEFFLNGRLSSLSNYINDDLTRAVINSLFSWRRASDDDELPGTSRHGWWGDTFSVSDQFGSRLWLLSRSKVNEETSKKAQEYAEEALAWLIEDGVAAAVNVTIERASHDRLDISVEVVKPNNTTESLRFQDMWSFLEND